MPLSNEDLKLLSELPLTAHGRAFFDWLKEECRKEDEDLKENPRVDNEDVKRDWRFKLGSIRRMEKIIKKPKEAAEELQTRRT